MKQNILEIQDRIANAALRKGRSPSDVILVAVTKEVGMKVSEALLELGIRHVGENKVQEAKRKKESMLQANRATWHMIGHLQTNKVPQALPIFDFFHSVDSLKLAEEMNKRAETAVPVLLEVNIASEPQKYGFSADFLENQIDALLKLDRLKVQGFMAMAPLAAEKEVCRKCFRDLRLLAAYLTEKTGQNDLSRHLSMGMSQDYEVAVEEGATIVRIGSAFFRGIDIPG